MIAPRHVDLEAIPAQRWKNGAGWTREIALGPAGCGTDDFGWRLSVAEVESDAPFSAFAGLERRIVVIAGGGMGLHDERGELVQTLRPLEPWAFAGEAALHARLASGACRDFNVMTRRAAWRSELAVLRAAVPVARGQITLLLAVRGRWQLGADSFDALQGRLLEGAGDDLAVAPLDTDAALLHVRLCQDRQP